MKMPQRVVLAFCVLLAGGSVGGGAAVVEPGGGGVGAGGVGVAATGPSTRAGAVKPVRLFVGERVSALKGARWEWAVIKKLGRHLIYVEWEGWEGFPGDWLPPEEVRRDGGRTAPFRKPKMKPGPVPPEPPMPGGGQGGGTSGGGGASDRGAGSGGGKGALGLVSDAEIKGALVIPVAERKIDAPGNPTGGYVSESVAGVGVGRRATVKIGLGLEGGVPERGRGFVEFGEVGRVGFVARVQGDRYLSVVKVNLESGERLGVWRLPADRGLIGGSADGRFMVTGAGFFGNYMEVWDTSGAGDGSGRRIVSFRPESSIESVRWAESLGGGRLMVGGDDHITVVELDGLRAFEASGGVEEVGKLGIRTVYRIEGVSVRNGVSFSPDRRHLAVAGRGLTSHVMRVDGTVVADVEGASGERLVFSADGSRVVVGGKFTIVDLGKGSRVACSQQWGRPVVLLDATTVLTEEGNVVDLGTGRRLWRFRVGVRGASVGLGGRLVLGRLWSLDEGTGTLVGWGVPQEVIDKARALPAPEDIKLALAGRGVDVVVETKGEVDEGKIKRMAAEAVGAVGARVVSAGAGEGVLRMKVVAERGNVRRKYSSKLVLPSFERGRDDETMVEVDCPFGSVRVELRLGDEVVWKESQFGGAGLSLRPPEKSGLQEYVNSLFVSPEELMGKVRLPGTVRDPETDEVVTTYLSQ